MTTHILYSYRDDELGGRELKYSLRSLDMFFKDDLEITIVGDKPSWMVDVSHLQAPASPDSTTKVQNILRAVYLGADYLLSEGVTRAIYCDDDYMLLDPVTDVLPLHRGSWAEYIKNRNRMWEDGIDWYRIGMEATDKVVGRLPASTTMSYEVHRPMPFDPKRAVALLENFLHVPPDECPFWRSTYGNLVGWPSGAHLARDVRAATSWPVGVPWISTDQKYWDKVAKRLGEWFPEPSRWER
jgi:hypothetical protein